MRVRPGKRGEKSRAEWEKKTAFESKLLVITGSRCRQSDAEPSRRVHMQTPSLPFLTCT